MSAFGTSAALQLSQAHSHCRGWRQQSYRLVNHKGLAFSSGRQAGRPQQQQQIVVQRGVCITATRHQCPSRCCRCRAGLDDKVLYSDEVPLSKLQRQLDQAIDDEDYEAAAMLRDVIQRRRFDNRLAVEEANERFYKAFQSGSLAAMSEVWGKGEHVQCIHPLCACIAGRQAVMESWKAVLGSARMKIEIEDVRIFASNSQAFVTCLELTESGENRGRIAATNIFEKQGGAWKLVHHHGSPVPPGPR